ncbi:glutaredoxin family protein [Allohahella sp. A8]|uniref:glutaredoxin family protein n=1 Tax=Allohahella sp. A8 TaxID=3141461 RepID=UPI0026B0CA41|tara:strand:- start:88796 stop:89062 length:267 start_codon:yes stop_codon:yes gene_type:complete
MTEFQLFATEGCTLCEVAEAMLVDLLGRHPQLASQLSIAYVDIAESEAMVDAYGLSIPVLAHSALELRWPFTQDEALDFLRRTSASEP